MGVIVALVSSNHNTAAIYVLAFFLYDLCAFVVFGPTPFQPTGVASQYFCWKIRGNATSTLMYKPVFLAYILTVGNYVLKNAGKSNGEMSEAGGFAFGGMILNSALLAVFRF